MIASDGFHIFIDTFPSASEIPIPIPAGMDALIILAQARKESKITQCFTHDQVPKLKYCDTYVRRARHFLQSRIARKFILSTFRLFVSVVIVFRHESNLFVRTNRRNQFSFHWRDDHCRSEQHV